MKYLIVFLMILIPVLTLAFDPPLNETCLVTAKDSGPVLVCYQSEATCLVAEEAIDKASSVQGKCAENSHCLVEKISDDFNRTSCYPDEASCQAAQSSTANEIVLACISESEMKSSFDSSVNSYELVIENITSGKQGAFLLSSKNNCEQIDRACLSQSDKCKIKQTPICKENKIYGNSAVDRQSVLATIFNNADYFQYYEDLVDNLFEDTLFENLLFVGKTTSVSAGSEGGGSEGGACQNDRDCDGIIDDNDNCPNVSNARGQSDDHDNDGIGDVCDLDWLDANSDRDNDGVIDREDICPDDPNPDQDDVCESDTVTDCGNPNSVGYLQNCLHDPLENECYTDFEGNRICEPNNIFTLIYKAIRGLTNILIPLAVLAIIWAGLQFVVAQGNESKITNAKKTLTNVLIGVALIVGARVIVEMINAIRLTL